MGIRLRWRINLPLKGSLTIGKFMLKGIKAKLTHLWIELFLLYMRLFQNQEEVRRFFFISSMSTKINKFIVNSFFLFNLICAIMYISRPNSNIWIIICDLYSLVPLVVKEPPYCVKESGYAGFIVNIEVRSTKLDLNKWPSFFHPICTPNFHFHK